MASGGPRDSGGVSVVSLVLEISKKDIRYNVQVSYTPTVTYGCEIWGLKGTIKTR